MACLYESKNKCIALKNKLCDQCSFYKENTKENFEKFIIGVRKDILRYSHK